MTTNTKLALSQQLMTAGVGGAILGGLYGLGDSKHNKFNKVLHNSTAQRASQGALAGLAGVGGYTLMKGLGKGHLVSGLAALLSAGGAAALANPKLPYENPYKLPF